MTDWVSSQFDNDDISSTRAVKSTRKRIIKNVHKRQVASIDTARRKDDYGGEMWVNKYAPKTPCEVAGNRKKIEDLSEWLKAQFTPCGRRSKVATILLLTGPSGCGKTAAIKTICKELGITVQEWMNPADEFVSTDERGDNSLQYRSQTLLFDSFILRANKYCPLPFLVEEGCTEKRVLLVEEIPGAFIRNPTEWHSRISDYTRHGRCPLIVIFNTGGEVNERSMFPDTLQSQLSMKHIAFNPIPKTDVKRGLQRIADSEKHSMIPREFVDHMAESCDGDIRAAINSMQFNYDCQLPPSALSKKRKTSQSQSKLKSPACNFKKPEVKDLTLILFRALGKVLYCKRLESQSPCEEKLASHLKHHRRNEMAFHPEQVFEQSRVSAEFYTLCLHQNLPHFLPDVHSAARAADYLADSDVLSERFSTSKAKTNEAAPAAISVAMRGIMHALLPGSKNRPGWLPMRKPECISINKQRRETSLKLRWSADSFCTTEILAQEMIPYLNSCDPTNPLCKMLPPYRTNFTRHNESNQLDERDNRIDLEEDANAEGAKPILVSNTSEDYEPARNEPEDEYTIEPVD